VVIVYCVFRVVPWLSGSPGGLDNFGPTIDHITGGVDSQVVQTTPSFI